MELLGKRALVTGGSRGIGAAIALTLAARGAHVAVTYQRAADRAATVVHSIEELGRRALAIQADSADPDAIRRAVTATVDALGGLDILVNSAGIATGGMTVDLSLADLQAMLDINVRAPILFAQAAIPHLSSGSRIVSIGSALAERVPFPGVTAYAMSKSALLAFTRGLARELGPQDITVNLVQPGSTDTDMNPANGENADYQRSLTALGRFGEPGEIASTVAFLAGPTAGLITGAVLNVDAGFNA